MLFLEFFSMFIDLWSNSTYFLQFFYLKFLRSIDAIYVDCSLTQNISFLYKDIDLSSLKSSISSKINSLSDQSLVHPFRR